MSLAWHMGDPTLYLVPCAALQELACRNKHVPYGSCSVIHTLPGIIQNCSLALALHPHGPCAQPEHVQVGTLTYATVQFLGSAVLVYLTCFIVARWALHKSVTGQGSISIVGV